MRTSAEKTDTKAGTSLPVVLGTILVVSILLAAVSRTAGQRAFTARQLACRIRAQALAETGVSHAYNLLAQDFEQRTNEASFPLTQYDGGTYDVSVTPLGEDNAVIRGVGTYASVRESVIVDVRRHVQDVAQQDVAYGYAILADGEISWTGCGVFEGDSRVHANSTFKQAGCGELNADISSSAAVTLKGNSGEIDGDVTAPDVSGKTGKVTGTITETAVPEVSLPVIDLVPYYNEALANGEVYEGGQTVSGDFSPVGGIMWVNGTLSFSGSGTRTGCFIATGDIHCSGSGQQIKVQGYPAFASRDGGIKFSGSGSCEGLVYARIGSVEITGSGRIDGSVICGSDFKKAGCSTVIAYVDSTPVSPVDVASDGVLCVSAWQR